MVRAAGAASPAMALVFVGSEAVAAGRVTKYDLRARHVRLFPDVYAPRDARLTVFDRTVAAWLWSRRRGVVAGLAASALHGSKWVDDDVLIELVLPNARAPRGIRTHDDELCLGESQTLRGLRVTTPARTAFDVGRRLPGGSAVEALDALGNATGLTAPAVTAVADQHPGARNVRKLKSALAFYDAGAQSPKETWLRLVVVQDGYPPPQTQLPIHCGGPYPRYYLDMAWPEMMIALEYDGAHHHKDPEQIRHDIERSEKLAEMGWIVIRVVAGMRPAEILYRVGRAWQRRDCSESENLAS